MRKQNRDNRPSEDDTDGDVDDHTDDLPVLKGGSTSLVEAPKKGVKIIVERGAGVYFAACRRIADVLNRDD